jgi:Cu/Ag efflux pump CusA
MRRGIAELDGEGEVAGGVIVMRAGKNALETIGAVRTKLDELAVDVRRYPGPRSGFGRAGCAACGRGQGETANGVSVQWPGQFEFLERAVQRLSIVVPFALAIIFMLLYVTFQRFDEAALLMVTLPFAVVSGFWYV